MEDKTFELLSKMYGEFTELRSDVVVIKKDVATLTSNFTRFEHTTNIKLDALFDGYTQNTERFDRVESKVDNLTDLVEHHEVKLKVIQA